MKETKFDMPITQYPKEKTRPLSLEVPITMPEATDLTDDSSPSEEFFDAPEESPSENLAGVSLQKHFEPFRDDFKSITSNVINVDTGIYENHKSQLCSGEVLADESPEIFQDAMDSEIKLTTISSSENNQNTIHGTLEESENINAKKPPAGPSQTRVSRFQKDFVPLKKRPDSIIKDETRKIIMMLENDKACKVPRPNLGLQDRLKSLMQHSSGKKTSYVKGPRFCNTIVRSIAKCANEKLAARKDSFQDFVKDRKGFATYDQTSTKSIFLLEDIPSSSTKTSFSDKGLSENSNAIKQTNGNISSSYEKTHDLSTLDTWRQSVGIYPNNNKSQIPTPMSWEDAVSTEETSSTVNNNVTQIFKTNGDKSEDVAQEETYCRSKNSFISSHFPSDEINLLKNNTKANNLNIVSDEISHCYTWNEKDVSPNFGQEHHPDESSSAGDNTEAQCKVVNTKQKSDSLERNETCTYTYEEHALSYHSIDDPPHFIYNSDNNSKVISNHYATKEQMNASQSVIDQTTETLVDHNATYHVCCEPGKPNVQSITHPPVNDNEKDSKKIPALDAFGYSTGYDEIKDDLKANLSTSNQNENSDICHPTPDNDILDNANTQPKEIKKRSLRNRMQQQSVKQSVTKKDLQQHIASLNKVSKDLVTKMADKKTDKNVLLKNVTNSIQTNQSSVQKVPRKSKDVINSSFETTKMLNKENSELHNSVNSLDKETVFEMMVTNETKSRGSCSNVMEKYSLNNNISTKMIIETDISKLKTDNLVKRHRGAHFQYRIPAELKKRKRLKSSSESQDYPQKNSESQKSGNIAQNVSDVSAEKTETKGSMTHAGEVNSQTERFSKHRHGSVDIRKLLQSKGRRSTMIERRHSCHPDAMHGISTASKLACSGNNFSQGMMMKCLEIAIDKCESIGWETKEPEIDISETALPQDLDKSLTKAIIKRDAEKVRVLLDLGANPNVKVGNTPALLRAARDGSLYIVQALEAAGAEIDARLATGDSALHIAARSGHSEVIVHLVKSGAHVDAINRNDVTPLQIALAHGHLEVAQMLLRMKADILAQNKIGETALEIANYLGYTGLTGTPREVRRDSAPGTRAEVLSSDIPIRVRMIQGIEEGCAATVESCLALGGSPNTIVPLALHWPARAGVLHRAAHHGEDLIAKLLIAAGADVNMRDIVGNTPLHAAAQAGHNKVVKVLLSNGAHIEATSQSGMTPLHRAASKGKDLTCNLLLRRCANSVAEDNNGCTPADWARKRGFKSLARKLFYRRRSSSILLAEANSHKQHLRHLNKLHQAALQAGQDIEMDYEE